MFISLDNYLSQFKVQINTRLLYVSKHVVSLGITIPQLIDLIEFFREGILGIASGLFKLHAMPCINIVP